MTETGDTRAERAAEVPRLSIREDVEESRATSSLSGCETVGQIREGLLGVQGWVVAHPADWCGPQDAADQVAAWVAYARHLLRKLPDVSVQAEVPSRVLVALDEVASWTVQLALRTDAPVEDVPHLASYFIAY
jgi:hypothetical protein